MPILKSVSEISRALPSIIGEEVVVIHKNNNHYGEHGLVFGFCTTHQKYIVHFLVQLHDSYSVQQCYFFASHLNVMSTHCNETSEVIKKIEKLNAKQFRENFQEALKIFEWLEKNRTQKISPYEIEVKANWGARIDEKLKINPEVIPKLLNIFWILLEQSKNYVRIQIIVKIRFFPLLISFGQDIPTNFFEEYTVCHYGFLPGIAISLSDWNSCRLNPKKSFQLYHRAMRVFKSQNYDSQCHIGDFFMSAANFLVNYFHVSVGKTKKQVLKEIKKFHKIAAPIMTSESCACHQIAEILAILGKFEEAIFCETKYMIKSQEKLGFENPMTFRSYKALFDYYKILGRKKDAKKCLDQLKKFDSQLHARRMEVYQKMPNEILQGKNKLSFKRVFKKCSFFSCGEVEKKIGEFEKCESCLCAYYCSKKCQKKHWKNGHKKQCKKKTNTKRCSVQLFRQMGIYSSSRRSEDE